MGIPILILGESGTGKSASMRNFKPGEIALANVAGKPLPFRGKFDETVNTDNYRKIKQFMKEAVPNVVVIDDAQYLMANEFMRRFAERGYDKFTEIAVNFWDLVQAVRELPPEKIVVFMAHIERDANGNEKIKTIGKLLDEKITVEGMFTIVLKTSVSDGKFSFMTQNSGHDTVKSPIGMFAANEIENDLKAVIDCVTRYYNFPKEANVEHGETDISTITDADVPPEENDDLPFTMEGLPEEEQKPRRGRKPKEVEQPKEEPKEPEKPTRQRRTRKTREDN